jgi:peptide/nickel transport system permease protein
MLLYLIRRIAAGLLVFVSVTGICFVLFNMRGGTAIAFNILGPDATADEIQLKVEQLGLDRPLVVQYVDWLTGLFRADLGRSFVSSQEVTASMSTRVPVTLSLVAVTLILTVMFAVLLGVLAATRGGMLDRGLQTLSVAVHAVPGYWLALVLVIVFSLTMRLFPATGYIPITTSFTGWLSSIFLPSVSIALGAIFGLAIWVRSSIIDIQRQDFVRTLRSRGISPRAIMYRHVLRNAAAPTVQMLGLMMIGLLGGAVIVERIFALPGVGTMALSSGQAGDVPIVLGAVTFMVIVVVVINLTVDLVLGFLNPKARVS